jgi:hypothetical protein
VLVAQTASKITVLIALALLLNSADMSAVQRTSVTKPVKA